MTITLTIAELDVIAEALSAREATLGAKVLNREGVERLNRVRELREHIAVTARALKEGTVTKVEVKR